jgi:hypothetical protein
MYQLCHTKKGAIKYISLNAEILFGISPENKLGLRIAFLTAKQRQLNGDTGSRSLRKPNDQENIGR